MLGDMASCLDDIGRNVDNFARIDDPRVHVEMSRIKF
jgi:hypothetical protein